MDLEPLKIERSPVSPRRRARASRWVGRAVVLALLVGALFFFRRPLLALADRWRLPEVRVVQVVETSPLATSAIQGTAANGYIVASKRAALSADTPGRIVEMNVTEGSVVRKGDVVARLYADEYRALLERAEADLGAARSVVASRRASREVALAGLARTRSSVQRAEADLVEANAALHLAELDLERIRQLVEERIISEQDLDSELTQGERARAQRDTAAAALEEARGAVLATERELALAEAQVIESEAFLPVKEAERDQARATLDKTEVRAPFDGIVVLKDAEVGEVVSPNAVGSQSRGSVATMVDFATLEVQVEVPETNLAAVEIGAPARTSLDAYPEHAYTGRVLRIWPTANRQKATVEVRVGFDAPDERLRPEMGARVVFTPAEAPAEDATQGQALPRIVIAKGAVVLIDGKTHVFVLERDVARLREIVLGDERSGRVVVERGLSDGERIVEAPPDSLQDGERVRVVE